MYRNETTMKPPVLKWIFILFCFVPGILVTAYSLKCGAQTSEQAITLRVCAYDGFTEPFIADFKQQMEDKYDRTIQFDIQIAPNPDVMFFTTFDGKADLVSPTHNLFKSEVWPFIDKNLVRPLDISQIDNYKYVLPEFQRTSFVTKDDEVYGVPMAAGFYALAYNADKMKEPPTSWDLLWDSDFKNRYSISEDYFDCNIYITALSMGVPYEHLYDPGAIFKNIPLHQLRERLNQLAENAYSFWEGSPNLEEMKDLWLMTTWGHAVVKANQRGMNWKVVHPKEGTTAWLDHWSITQAVLPNSIKYKICMEWLNYMLSKKVQEQVVRTLGNTPVTTNVVDLFTTEEIESYKIADSEYWSQISFWDVMDAHDIRVGQALWRYAVAQKTSQDRMQEYFQDMRHKIESQAMPMDSKRLGNLDFSRDGEEEQETGLEADQAELSIKMDDELLHRMRIMAIKRRISLDQLLEEAVYDFLKKNNELPINQRE